MTDSLFWKGRETAVRGVRVGGVRGWIRFCSRVFQNALMHIGFGYTLLYTWQHGLSWLDFAIFLVMLLITGFGVTVGLHRFLTHRAFEAPTWVRFWFAVTGSMAMASSAAWWVADHNRHHALSEQPGDAHSPFVDAVGKTLGKWEGIWHSHMGWQFTTVWTDLDVWGRHIKRDRAVMLASYTHYLWVALGFALPWAAGYWLGGSREAATSALLWGGFGRAIYVHHAQLCTASISHLIGDRPFRQGNMSRNCKMIYGLLTLGEGWHNSHHQFPQSGKLGLFDREPDLSWFVIKCLEHLGLARHVVSVPPKILARAMQQV